MPTAFIVFHLNLAYSSIAEKDRKDVIDRCYWPILQLVEADDVPLGIEMTSWTLREIQRLDPTWVARFKHYLASRQCELIGSGYCQIIGPLVPYDINCRNQRYGVEDYHDILDITPDIALINEMAYSSGMVGVYKDAGYRGIIMDRDNVCLALGRDNCDLERMPLYADGGDGVVLPVLWSDSILFQKFQRYAHGDISINQYLNYFWPRFDASRVPIPIYCNDAEVFDYRPGRYATESVLEMGTEWQRISVLLNKLRDTGINFTLPGSALDTESADDHKADTLNSASYPIPVKKQLKYNISRWAITGHNDLWLNTQCHKIYQAITDEPFPGKSVYEKSVHEKSLQQTQSLWRRLCYCWSSDFRTHITDDRWQQVCTEIETLCGDARVAKMPYKLVHPLKKATSTMMPATKVPSKKVSSISIDEAELSTAGFRLGIDAEEQLLSITTEHITLNLNLRRGITIDSLAYRSHHHIPVLGTLHHGYFKSIEHGADFYSAGVVIELIGGHRRITDLEPVTPALFLRDDELVVQTRIHTDLGDILKEYRIPNRAEQVTVSITFPNWERPLGTVRAGTITLLPDAFSGPLSVQARMGGHKRETFSVDETCLHDRPASSLVSCTTGLGLPDGQLIIGDDNTRLSIDWDVSQCAVFTMLYHQKVSPSMLTRVIFSLCEIDETFRPGGSLPQFEYRLSPC